MENMGHGVQSGKVPGLQRLLQLLRAEAVHD